MKKYTILSNINKWAAMLGVFAVFAALPSNTAHAQNKEVTAGVVVETGSTYASIAAKSALQVYNAGVSYSGTNLTLSATFNTGNGRFGAYAYNNSVLALAGGTVTTIGTNGYGVHINGTSSGNLKDVSVNTAGTTSYGAYANASSTLAITGGSIATEGRNSVGFQLKGASSGSASNLRVTTSGYAANGITADDSSILSLTDVNIATSGSRSYGIYTTGSSSSYLKNVTIRTYEWGGQGIAISTGCYAQYDGGSIEVDGWGALGASMAASSTMHLSNLSITTKDDSAVGLYMRGGGSDWSDGSKAVLNNTQIIISGSGVDTYGIRGGGSGYDIIELHDSSVIQDSAKSSALFMVGVNVRLLIDNSEVASNGYALTLGTDDDRLGNFSAEPSSEPNLVTNNYDVTILNGSVLRSGGGKDAIHVNTLMSGTLSDGDGTIYTSTLNVVANINLDNAIIDGSVSVATSAVADIIATNTTVFNGAVNIDGCSEMDLGLGNGSIVNGTIAAKDSSNLVLDVSGSSQINGDINLSGSSNTAMNLTNGTIAGDIENKGNGDLEIDGTKSLIGDVINSGGGNTTVDLDNSAMGNGSNTGSGTLMIDAGNGSVIDGVTNGGSGDTNINLDNSTLTGGATNSGSGDLTVTGSNGAVITGSMINSGGGNLSIDMINGTITGDLVNSGSGNTSIDLDQSTFAGDIENKGAGDLAISGSGSSITGDITNSGSGSTTIDVSDTTLNGDIANTGAGSIVIDLSGTSQGIGSINGDNTTLNTGTGSGWAFTGSSNVTDVNNDGKITIGDGGDVTVINPITGSGTTNINNGGTGTGGFTGGTGTVIIDNGGNWNFDRDSDIGNLVNNGTANIGNHDNYIDVNTGTIGGNGTIVLPVNTDTGDKSTIHTGTSTGTQTVVIDTTGNGTGDPSTILDGIITGGGTGDWKVDPIDWGLEQVDVGIGPDGKPTVKPTTNSSSAGALVKGMTAIQQTWWFMQQNSMLKRMGELRMDNAPTTGNLWVRAYAQELNVDRSVSGRAYDQRINGIDAGIDHRWDYANGSRLYTGVYFGYGETKADYHTNQASANSSGSYGGLYAAWLNKTGWYADLVLKGLKANNHQQGVNSAGTAFEGEYSNTELGFSVELGKQFKRADGWFYEPQIQVAYLNIHGSNYELSNGLAIDAESMTSWQTRGGITGGRELALDNGTRLQYYLKASVVNITSSGGWIRGSGSVLRPNVDGTRVEFGGGVVWAVTKRTQLHLDYETSYGNEFEKPWGLTFGWRYSF